MVPMRMQDRYASSLRPGQRSILVLTRCSVCNISVTFIQPSRACAWNNAILIVPGISFVDHVKAGYRFLMRYYEPGDDIYMLGFSRGAYTARFLAEMIHDIGLLSRGNEEMVHFVWDTFSTYQESRGNDPQSQTDLQHEQYMKDFKRTFCRPCLHVHFLGLFDCVNSVGRFEIPLFRKSYRYITTPAAQYIRHAVSVHERRLKFKPALCLFGQDQDGHAPVDLKEVWFAGNHGDVGGGWPMEHGYLLSDTPLNWMVQEMLSCPGQGGSLAVLPAEVDNYKMQAGTLMKADQAGRVKKPIKAHDPLRYGYGSSRVMTFIWWIIGESCSSRDSHLPILPIRLPLSPQPL